MTYYFFRTRKEGRRERLNALPGQHTSDGTPVQTGLNVQTAAGGKEMREAYPVGTVFCALQCEKANVSTTPYYCVGTIYPIVEPGNEIGSFPRATAEMREAYEEYLRSSRAAAAEGVMPGVEAAPAPKSKSLLERLMSDSAYAVPTVEKDGFYVNPDDWFLLVRNILKKANTMLSGPSGAGKCLGKDTPVLMYDGSIKMVQDVKVGDVLMGPDSKPRNVLSTTTGREELFRITPKKGDAWVCNRSHILSLERTQRNCNPFLRYENVCIEDYLKWSRNKKKNYMQWRTAVNFPYRPVEVDPYFLGLWLGDGRTDSPTINSADVEIAMYLEDYAKTLGCKVSEYYEKSWAVSYGLVRDDRRNSRTRSSIQARMDRYNLFGNKHIPNEYLHNCRKTRLAVLAGLIDSDGCRTNGCYEYSTKLERLKDDVVHLCRSLGLYVHAGVKEVNGTNYWRLCISGNLSDVPVLLERKKITSKHRGKNALHTSFTVESMGEGDYYGFTIDGDHLFLLGDFTVTHNTELVMLAARKLGLPCHVYDMGSMLDPVSSLLGVHRLVAGGSEFDYSKFVEDVQKPGVVLLDELSRAPLSCHNILFPCLDSRRMLPVEIAGADDIRAVEVHPDCVFIATANIGAEYTGTQILDRALTGRFFPLELGYMGEEQERDVLSKRCGIAAEDAQQVISVARTLRSLHSKGEISATVSTRETLAAGRMVSDGWTVLQSLERSFLPLYEGTRTEGERSIVYNTFLKH